MRTRLGLRWGSDRGVLWLGSSLAPKGSSNDRFKNEMWNLECLKMDAKGRFEFSQRRGDFAVGGQFRSGGAFSQPI